VEKEAPLRGGRAVRANCGTRGAGDRLSGEIWRMKIKRKMTGRTEDICFPFPADCLLVLLCFA
jgi:hypothetical protein